MLINQSNADISAFTNLAYARILPELDSKNLYGTNLDLCLSLVKQDLVGVAMTHIEHAHYYPRISLRRIKQLYRSVKRKHLHSFSLVSNLYATGLGVPRNQDLAFAWDRYSTLSYQDNTTIVSYDDLLHRFKQDIHIAIASSPDGLYAYLDQYLVVLDAAKRILSTKQADLPTVGQIFRSLKKQQVIPKYSTVGLSVKLAGIPVLLFYKNTVGTGVRLIEIACKLNNKIFSLLEVGTRIDGLLLEFAKTNPHYVDSLIQLYESKIKQTHHIDPKTHQMFVVEGVLTVPANKRKELRSNLPEIKSVKELITSLMTYNYEDQVEQLKKPDPSKMSAKKYERRLAKLQIARSELRKKNPVKYLKFVAQSVYGYDPTLNVVETIPIPLLHRSTHLASAGFYTAWVPEYGIPRIVYNLKELNQQRIDKELKLANKNAQYTVKGFNIEPNYTLNLVHMDRLWIGSSR
jgi:hypothetical protein